MDSQPALDLSAFVAALQAESTRPEYTPGFRYPAARPWLSIPREK